MRILPMLAVLAIVTVALSGCSTKQGGNDDPTASSTGTGTGTGTGAGTRSATATGTGTSTGTTTGTGTGAPAENHAPVVQFTANVSAGQVPFKVAFSLNGTDSDGDALTWELSFDDSTANVTGTELPTNFNHTYDAAGIFNATLAVSDGRETIHAKLSLQAVVGTPAYDGPPPFVIAGEWVGADAEGNDCLLGLFDIGGHWHTFSEELDNWNYVIDQAGFEAHFLKDDAETYTGHGGDSGVVPADSAEVDICNVDPARSAGGTYKFTATHPDYVAPA